MLSQISTSKELTSTISSKGQVTLPIKIRLHLGVETNDKVAFIIEPSGEVKVTQARYPTVESLRGVAGKLKQPKNWKKVKQIAYEDRLKNTYVK